MLFAAFVGVIWFVMKGPVEHGISVVAFCVSGYIPLVLFRHVVSRSVGAFKVNASLMYHKQIKLFDFILVRFLVELVGHLMAYMFVGLILWSVKVFPNPFHIGWILLGWLYYSYFDLAIATILAPLCEVSELVEKLIPVTTYIMIPFSGTFYMVSWLVPQLRDFLLYFPPVHAMEMMRLGIFGWEVWPHFEIWYPLAVSTAMLLVGLALCRKVRRTLVVA